MCSPPAITSGTSARFSITWRQPRLLRPANYPEGPGSGVFVQRAHNGVDCAVINLQGRTYMPSTDCPFRKADQILAALDPAVKVKFVDFHAEVTSEKIAMGWYLDGRVSAVVGTHTHVPRRTRASFPAARPIRPIAA
jgi:2',3'-cyclic-nucleotide 2'-phosphodiesterase